jgi:hypothetical protein
MGRVFVIHTETPRFIAEAIPGAQPFREAAIAYRPIDDIQAWANGQPGGAPAAMNKLAHDVGEFYVSYLDTKQSLS